VHGCISCEDQHAKYLDHMCCYKVLGHLRM
jgi:hypothetical protein